MKKSVFLVMSSALILSACGGGTKLTVGGPVAPPDKPVYQPYVPDMPGMDDFIVAAGSNTVLFDTDSSRLDAVARETLDRQAAWLMTHYDKNVLVEGHADSRATGDYNFGLGRRRAKAVVDYFVVKGLTRARFTARSFGEGKPIVPEPGDIQINRRAVTVILDENGTDAVINSKVSDGADDVPVSVPVDAND